MQASAGPLTERPAAGSVAEFIYLNKMKNFEARTHRESKTFYHLVEVGPGRAGVSEGPTAARVLPRGSTHLPCPFYRWGRAFTPRVSHCWWTAGWGWRAADLGKAACSRCPHSNSPEKGRLGACSSQTCSCGGGQGEAGAGVLPMAYTGQLGGTDCWGQGSSWALLWAPRGCAPGAPLSLGKGRAPAPSPSPLAGGAGRPLAPRPLSPALWRRP